MAHPFESHVLPGYIVDIQYLYESPPTEFLLLEQGYYDGYYKIKTTVTKDNLSVAEQTRDMFMFRPYGDPQKHGTLKFGDTMVIPLGFEQRILHLVTGCKCLNIGQGPVDFDLIFFLLSTEQDDDYGLAWQLFKHDKEEQFEMLLG